MESNKETRKLAVKLTRDEYDAKSAQLASKNKELEREKENKKQVAKSMGDQIKILEEEVSLLSTIVHTRVEDRDVECVEIRDEDRMVMHVVRCDTNDIVETRPMSPAERQLVMFPASRLRVVEGGIVEEDLAPVEEDKAVNDNSGIVEESASENPPEIHNPAEADPFE